MRKQDFLMFGFIALLSFFLLSPRQAMVPGQETSEEVASLENEDVKIKALSPMVATTGPSVTIAAVQTLATKYITEIPTVDTVKKEETHYTPDAVLEGGEVIGKVVDQIKDNPKLVKEGLEFFAQCTKKTDIPIAVRAVCYRRLKDWSTKTATPLSLPETKVPEFLSRLANELGSDFE